MPRIRAGCLRVITMLFFFGLAAVGLAFKTGLGTLCDLGYGAISAICPLGALETALAGRAFPMRMLVALACAVIVIVILGRFFCAWICPAPIFRDWILGNKKSACDAVSPMETAVDKGVNAQLHPRDKNLSIEVIANDMGARGVPPACSEKCGLNARVPGEAGNFAITCIDSRHFVLGGALLSSAIFGFPVFCLVCPVGLVIATFIGVWRLFQYNEPSWMLLVFPAIFILEIVVCRKWCRKICPLGALISILSNLNPLFQPRVNRGLCRHALKTMDCGLCKSVCEENIDLHHSEKSRPMAECTKCRECAEVCPAGAISFPLFSKKQK